MADQPDYLSGDNLPDDSDSPVKLLHRQAGSLHNLYELAKAGGAGLTITGALDAPEGVATEAKQDALAALVGEVQASPTANTLLDRLKTLLTGIVLAAGSAIIGKVGIDQTTDGTTNRVASAPKQTSAAPSSFTVATANATVFTLAAGERGFIQNLDDAALAVKLGASASSSSFNMILKAGSVADDGEGGYVKIDNFIGAVSVAAMTGSPRFIAWKQTI